MRDILMKLVDKNTISINSLAKIAKTSEDEIKKYLDGDYIISKESNMNLILFLNQFGALIDEGFKIDADTRIKAIIDIMLMDYELSLKQISLLIDSDLKLLEDIYYSTDKISAEVKYQIAIKLYFLFYVMK